MNMNMFTCTAAQILYKYITGRHLNLNLKQFWLVGSYHGVELRSLLQISGKEVFASERLYDGLKWNTKKIKSNIYNRNLRISELIECELMFGFFYHLSISHT